MFFQNILAAIAVVVNGLPQGLLALTFGFATFPTALAFILGILGMLLFGQVAPISFQAESIVLAGTLGRNRQERLNIVFFTGLAMAAIGGCKLLQPTIDFIGLAILNGMMAGVGIMLAKVSVDMVKANPFPGGLSLAGAVFMYFLTKNLVYTIVFSVFISTLVWVFTQRKEIKTPDLSSEKLVPLRFCMNRNVLRSVLGLITLQIGGNIAYATITANLANSTVSVDHVTLYSGLADAISSFFGGGPVEAIISGTAVAPNPVFSGVCMMTLMTIILLLRLLPRLARYVPSESIAGFLFVLGAIVVFPVNISAGLKIDPVITSITAITTSATDPFLGMLSGIATRFLIQLF